MPSSTRRIVAIQHGAQIFNMSASFQVVEEGIDHQVPMPQVPPPEDLHEQAWHYRKVIDQLPPALRRMLELKRPFEFRPVQPPSFLTPEVVEPSRDVWFRAVAPLPDDEPLHRCLLAYVSDYELLGTALVPHGRLQDLQHLMMASIDHAMWFHRNVRVDDWLLYSTDSPSASGARGFARGGIFSRDGRLVASTCQEGLLRMVKPR